MVFYKNDKNSKMEKIKIYDCASDKKLTRVAKLSGHRGRVLHLALSPDGTAVVTGSSDETLKFWDVFPKPREPLLSGLLPRGELALPSLR